MLDMPQTLERGNVYNFNLYRAAIVRRNHWLFKISFPIGCQNVMKYDNLELFCTKFISFFRNTKPLKIIKT